MKILAILFLSTLLAFSKTAPNIILIMADDKGHNEAGFTTGTSEFSTPRIDALAAGGANLAQFHVQGACSPTRSELMTGRWCGRLGMQYAVIGCYSNDGVPKEEKFVSEYLRDIGYTCGWFGKWHIGKMHPEFLPHQRGFDVAKGIASGANRYTNRVVQPGLTDFQVNGIVQDTSSTKYFTYQIRDDALDFIDKQAEDTSSPFFAYVAITTPHTPLVAPSDVPYAGPSGKSSIFQTRWRMTKAEDNMVGDIVDRVEALGLTNNTLIIYTSDNGGELAASLEADNFPHKGGKADMAEGGVHVPCLAYWPGTIAAGTTVNQVLDAKDILPTLLEGVAGQRKPDYRNPLDGRNFLPLLTGGSDPVFDTRIVIGGYGRERGWYAYRGSKKYGDGISHVQTEMTAALGVYTFMLQRFTPLNRTMFPRTKEVYDLNVDPGEATNIYNANVLEFEEIESYMNSLEEVLPNNLLTPWGTRPPGWTNPPTGTFGNFKDFYNPNYFYFRN